MSMSTEPTPLPAPDLEAAAIPQPLPSYPPWRLWDVLAIALVAFGSLQVLGLIGAVVAVRLFHVPLAGLDRNPKLAVPVELSAYAITLAFMAAVVRSRGFP